MADSILSCLLSVSALKIHNDSDTTGDNAALELKVSKVSIGFRSRPMRHMKEDGTSIVDVRIIDPTQLNIEVFAPSLASINILNIVLANKVARSLFPAKGLFSKRWSLTHWT